MICIVFFGETLCKLGLEDIVAERKVSNCNDDSTKYFCCNDNTCPMCISARRHLRKFKCITRTLSTGVSVLRNTYLYYFLQHFSAHDNTLIKNCRFHDVWQHWIQIPVLSLSLVVSRCSWALSSPNEVLLRLITLSHSIKRFLPSSQT